jgi:hypothetical protein
MTLTMKSTTILTFLICLSVATIAQNYNDQYKKLNKSTDTTAIKLLLMDWEKSNPNDAEFYVAALNYHFSASRQEIVNLSKDAPTAQSFELTDSIGKIVGYLSSTLGYDPEKIKTVLNYANKAIGKFPDRLDIRFGKCYVLTQIEDYETFTSELIKLIEYSEKNKNNWLWTENKKLDSAQDFMLNTIQEYLKQLYDKEDDALLPYMQRIGDATIASYPNNVEILSTTAVAHLLTKNYDKAIGYLKLAEKINPKDFIILNNIAQGYKMRGDIENSIKYYQLTEKYGDKQAKEQARKNISELKKLQSAQ